MFEIGQKVRVIYTIRVGFITQMWPMKNSTEYFVRFNARLSEWIDQSRLVEHNF